MEEPADHQHRLTAGISAVDEMLADAKNLLDLAWFLRYQPGPGHDPLDLFLDPVHGPDSQLQRNPLGRR